VIIMSIVLICDKGQINTSLEKFVEYLKTLIPTPGAKQEGATDIIPNEGIINAADFVTKGKQFLKKNELSALVQHILTLDDLLFRDSKQAVSIFYILGSICSKIEDAQEQTKIIQQVNDHVMKLQTPNYALKFRVLAALFSSFPENSHTRLTIFRYLLKLAEESKRPSVLLVHLVNLDQYLSQWNVNAKESFEIYKDVLKMLEKAQEKFTNERVEIYIKFLNFLEKQFEPKLVVEFSNEIQYIIVFMLKNFPKDVNYGKLLDTKAIKEMAKIDAGLSDLLNISVQGNVSEYEKGKQNLNSAIQKHGLNLEQLTDRIRLNSIFQLARDSKSLKLKDVAAHLNLSVEEAEITVVKAIQNGDLEGKIDQIQEVLYIKSINDPSFKSNEWRTIGDKLENFRKTYVEFADILKKNKK